MMYSQGLKLFYNRGLHLLVSNARPATVGYLALTQQSRAFSVYNTEAVSRMQS